MAHAKTRRFFRRGDPPWSPAAANTKTNTGGHRGLRARRSQRPYTDIVPPSSLVRWRERFPSPGGGRETEPRSPLPPGEGLGVRAPPTPPTNSPSPFTPLDK